MIELRDATEEDLDFVIACQSDPDAAPYIAQPSREQLRGEIAAADTELLLISEDGEPIGFALVGGLTSPHDSVEIRRMAVTRRGEGVGRRALAALVDRAFERHGAHRVWLDVITDNERAQRAYEAVGFVREGVLREAWRKGERRESLVVMSILAPEWSARPAPGER